MVRVHPGSRRVRGIAIALATLLLSGACGSTPPTGAPASAVASGAAPTGDGSSTAPGSLPPPSAVGATTGPIVTKVIGATGGGLASADGRVTVTIPAGALTTDTTIGIQPIEDTAPSGLGHSVALTPAGQAFAQPVQVSFAYAQDDLEWTSLEALGIAFQDEGGRWEWQPTVAVDTSAKRLSVTTTRFGAWSDVVGLQLRPRRATVKVNSIVTLVAAACLRPAASETVYMGPCVDFAEDDETAPLAGVKAATWAVDGQVGGGPATGTIRGGRGSAVFEAPARKPSGTGGVSTVAVSVMGRVRGGPTTLVADIAISGGEYAIVGTFNDRDSSLACPGAVSPLVIDSVTFSLQQADNGGYAIADIVNAQTAVRPVRLPAPAPGASVKLVTPPEILTADSGAASVSGDEVTVVLAGPTTLGLCRFSGGGPTGGTADTHDSSTGIVFDITKFVGGKQTATADEPQWTWIVTER